MDLATLAMHRGKSQERSTQLTTRISRYVGDNYFAGNAYAEAIFVLDVLGIYILGILVAWNLLGLKTVLYPMKMLTVAYHEFWHIVVGVCLGQKLHEVSLDPTTGGRTVFNAEEPIAAPTQPVAAYFVAMVGNALVGSLLVFCGFNTLASKIASFFIGFSFCAVSLGSHMLPLASC